MCILCRVNWGLCGYFSCAGLKRLSLVGEMVQLSTFHSLRIHGVCAHAVGNCVVKERAGGV